MTLEFVKAHSSKDGRHYTAGQIADISDATAAQDLIRQGIAKEHKSGGAPAPPESEKKQE
jgi:hypothetical protein